MKIKNISIKWKILFGVAVGPIVIAVVLAWLRVADIRNGAQTALVEKSQAIVFMTEAVRKEMGLNFKAASFSQWIRSPPTK